MSTPSTTIFRTCLQQEDISEVFYLVHDVYGPINCHVAVKDSMGADHVIETLNAKQADKKTPCGSTDFTSENM